MLAASPLVLLNQSSLQMRSGYYSWYRTYYSKGETTISFAYCQIVLYLYCLYNDILSRTNERRQDKNDGVFIFDLTSEGDPQEREEVVLQIHEDTVITILALSERWNPGRC